MTKFLKELRQHVDDRNVSYFTRKVQEIKQEIFRSAGEGYDSTWITFCWEEGDYAKIIEYFESEGLEVGSPTGLDNGMFTDYLFKWKL